MTATIYQFPSPASEPELACVVPECVSAPIAAVTRELNLQGSYSVSIRPDLVNVNNEHDLYCKEHTLSYASAAVEPINHPSVGLK